MSELRRLEGILERTGIPKDKMVVVGSGAMVLHGMERELTNDVDIYVPTRTWYELLMSGSWMLFTTEPEDPKRRADPAYLYWPDDGIEVNVFHAWRRRGIGDIDVAFWLLNCREVENGWRAAPLQFVLDLKEELGRAKDQVDIESIKRFMAPAA